MLVTGAGQISMAIARRFGFGKKIILGDKKINAEHISRIMAERKTPCPRTPKALLWPKRSVSSANGAQQQPRSVEPQIHEWLKGLSII